MSEKQDSYRNEWYLTDQELASSILDEFVKFVDHENIEKEKRRKLYEELKKEFENATQEVDEEKMKNDPCWDGYEMIGTKEKDGKKVPNCVKKD